MEQIGFNKRIGIAHSRFPGQFITKQTSNKGAHQTYKSTENDSDPINHVFSPVSLVKGC